MTEFRFPIYDSQQRKYTKIRYTTGYIITPLAEYVRQKGLKLHWYPYSNDYTWKSYVNMDDNKWSDWEKLKESLYCKRYGVDVPIIQTGYAFPVKSEKTPSDLLNCLESIKRLKSGVMFEIGSSALESETYLENLLNKIEELYKIYTDDEIFYNDPINNIQNRNFTNIEKSALIDYYFDAYIYMRFLNIVKVYKYNCKEYTNNSLARTDAQNIIDSLYPWNYRWNVNEQIHEIKETKTQLIETNDPKHPYKIQLFYRNDSTVITDIHMQRVSALMDNISKLLIERNK